MRKILLLLLLAAPAFAQATPHYIQLSCSGQSGATFSVYKGTASGAEGSTPLIANLAACSYNDTAAVMGTKYYYVMTQTVGGVESGPSSEVSAQIVQPNPPTNPTATVH